MADRPVISPENTPTIIAVAAVSALLAFAFSIFVYRELKAVTIGAVKLDQRAATRDEELQKEIVALEARLKVLEAAAVAPTATPVPVTEGATAAQ